MKCPDETPEDLSLTPSSTKYSDTSSSHQSNQQVPINGKRVETRPSSSSTLLTFLIILYSSRETIS
jgi:hypothetical protein